MERQPYRRAWRVGSSLVVTIPKVIVQRLGLRPGDLVGVSFTPVEVLVRAPDIAQQAMFGLLSTLTPALLRLREIDGGPLAGAAWQSD